MTRLVRTLLVLFGVLSIGIGVVGIVTPILPTTPFLLLAGVLLASPANPTGTVTGRRALTRLVDYCNGSGITFMSDEIYHGLSFRDEETTALSISDDVLVINSFSKYYCMTGWRIGWMVLPEPMIRPVERVAQSLYISAPELSQIAACAAFEATRELESVKQGYRRNRDLLIEQLRREASEGGAA